MPAVEARRALSDAPGAPDELLENCAATRGTMSSHGINRPVLIGWFLTAVVLLLATAADIANLRFPDPDDAMRLMEVRDWLAGQSWWDVAQHRLNGNFPMHWSRLVDLPIATVLAVTRLFVSEEAAIRVAMVVVPLLSLLAVMTLVADMTRRLSGAEAARYAVLLVPLSAPLVFQLRPMRVDHHGWQIVLALVAVAMLVGRTPAPGREGAGQGAIAGLALAMLLTISLEGMPIAAAIAGVAALAWVLQPWRRDFLLGLVWSLFGGAVLLHAVTRGPNFWAPACDAIAPGWLAMLGTAAVATSVAAALFQQRQAAARLGGLLGAGGLTAGVLVLVSPDCLAGPFARLPPIVHDIWYVGVSEGRPLWEQTPDWAAMTIGLPLVGLYATWRGYRSAQGELRVKWLLLLAILTLATLVAVFVNRAGATANALAIPGAATLLLALLKRARAVPGTGRRLVATAGALLVASPGQVAAIGVVAGKAVAADDRPAAQSGLSPEKIGRGSTVAGQQRPSCEKVGDVRVIGRLPRGIVFAPIDIGPDIIATTHHDAIAGGYHRAPEPMERVLSAFTGSPAEARRIIMASGASYIAACPGLSETETYRRDFPQGFWARLQRGERFDWLQPIATGTPALGWRVIRPLPPVARRP
ncbi:MAG: hypothetical protein K0S66_1645 [Sphingomonas sp.]|nr:hypothetical protein [Sphingomonas sp.]